MKNRMIPYDNSTNSNGSQSGKAGKLYRLGLRPILTSRKRISPESPFAFGNLGGSAVLDTHLQQLHRVRVLWPSTKSAWFPGTKTLLDIELGRLDESLGGEVRWALASELLAHPFRLR